LEEERKIYNEDKINKNCKKFMKIYLKKMERLKNVRTRCHLERRIQELCQSKRMVTLRSQAEEHEQVLKIKKNQN